MRLKEKMMTVHKEILKHKNIPYSKRGNFIKYTFDPIVQNVVTLSSVYVVRTTHTQMKLYHTTKVHAHQIETHLHTGLRLTDFK